ncbi:MAG: outer membrane beta-barrel protein [Pseudomonadota bacterium]
MKHFLSATSIGFAMSLALTGTAQAQNEYFSRDKYEAVTDRRQPDFDPNPVRVGAYSVLPYAEAGAEYETNVFALEEDEEGDTVIFLGAGVRADSNWSRHDLSLFANTRYNEYLDFSDNSAANTTIGANGRIDVTRGFSLAPRVAFSDLVEQRGDFAGAQGLAEPIQSTRLNAGLDADYSTGRFRFSAGGSIAEADFDDTALLETTGELDQDFRDQTTTEGRVQATYAVNPNFAVFAQATASQADYDETVLIDSIERDRDRDQYTVRAGADFELNALLRGNVGVGYFESDVEDEFFQDTDGLSVDASVTWFPSRITNVIFTGRRGVVDFGLIEAASAVQTAYGARVVHELRRNIVLGAGVNYSEEEYEDVDRTDDRINFSADATYKLNPHVHFQGFARTVSRDTSGADENLGRAFDNQVVGVSVRLFP